MGLVGKIHDGGPQRGRIRGEVAAVVSYGTGEREGEGGFVNAIGYEGGISAGGGTGLYWDFT